MAKEQSSVPTKASSSRSAKRAKFLDSVFCLSCDDDQEDTEEETDPANTSACRFHTEKFPFTSSEDNIDLETCCLLRVKHVNEELGNGIRGMVRICLFPDCNKLSLSGFSTCMSHGATPP
jgi:hypothetical protein